MKSTKKGFTLVELLVVIAILAILATVSVVGYTAFIEKAHQSVAMQEMTQIRNALVAEDITNKNFNLEDGISGEGIETVYAAEGDPVGGQSEAFYVLEFVKELGIAGTFQVSEGKLLFSPAGKDATATCDFVTGEISTAKGALEDDDQSTEPVEPECYHNNATDDGDCTTPVVCECGEIVVEARAEHIASADDNNCATEVKCQNCDHICVEAKEHVAPDTGILDCTVDIECANDGCDYVIREGNDNHTPGADDGDCTTPIYCSNEYCDQIAVEAKEHVAGEDDSDCTTDIICSNPGCNQVAEEGNASHTAGEDDGDCTTPIYCSNEYCDQIAVEAKEHVAGEDDGNCTTAVKCINCDMNAVEAKANHTFGNDGKCENCNAIQKDAVVARFELGADGVASHSDGSELYTGEFDTIGAYTLDFSAVTKAYKNARDQEGNGCIKLGASGDACTLTFAVPEDVTKVIIYIAGYKNDTAKISVNDGETQTISTLSNNGEYTAIEIDTSVNKTVTLKTVSGGYRAMVNAIEYVKTVVCEKHEYTEATCAAPATCKICGTTQGEALSHTEETIDGTDATCTEKGLTTGTKCSVCDKILVAQQEIPALGHNYGDGVETTAPTCTTAGEKTFTCGNCGDTYTDAIPATGHNYVEGTCSVCGSEESVLVETTYTYEFTATQFSANGTQALGGINWTLAGDGGYWGYDGTKGQQIGSGSKPYKSATLTSTSFNSVSKIVINTSGASGINGNAKVYVDATEVGTIALTKTATEYTFDVANLTGAIKLVYTQTSSVAIYIKSIEVTYMGEGQEGEGGETPDQGGDSTESTIGQWVLVTDASTLSAGDQIVIVDKNYNFALSTQNGNYRSKTDVTLSDNTLQITDSVQIITLTNGTTSNTFGLYTGDGYLAACSSSSNNISTNEILDANSSWEITIKDGVASIIAQGNYSRKYLQYNSSSPRFSCYGSASQTAVAIYKYVEQPAAE